MTMQQVGTEAVILVILCVLLCFLGSNEDDDE